jgi:hypothetical protein
MGKWKRPPPTVPTYEQIAELLSYDPDTGFFIWKKSGRGMITGEQAGSVNNNGHRIIGIMGRRYVAHRLAWLLRYGVWPDKEIDHRDRVGEHNWISNLRLATHQENMRNGAGRHGGASRFRGVGKSSSKGKWTARIRIGGKPRGLGAFISEIDAARAYDAAARLHYGEFAVLNFPTP